VILSKKLMGCYNPTPFENIEINFYCLTKKYKISPTSRFKGNSIYFLSNNTNTTSFFLVTKKQRALKINATTFMGRE
jgi:hypothetical protein